MKLSVLAMALFASTSANAAVTLAPLFTDHAVLQRDKPVPVWGWAEPNEKVEVWFADQKVQTTADGSGRWVATLNAMAAQSNPTQLLVKGTSGTVECNDVLVGDVWLCSGQSNMEWPMAMTERVKEDTPLANYPLIRQLKVMKTKADSPQDKVPTDGAWVPCSPETVQKFTAVGYYFAKDLHTRFQVPIGLINSTWGGSAIEAWLPPDAYQNEPSLNFIVPRWEADRPAFAKRIEEFNAKLAEWTAAEAAAKQSGKPFTDKKPETPGELLYPSDPRVCYNGMIHPLTPAALRGFLWYQGESNTGRANEYAELFTTMILYWRKHFVQEDLPFYWVQLANYEGWDQAGLDWARLREAQTAALQLPSTGQVITLDVGEAKDLHPRNKHEVGRRLALIARAQLFGQSVDYSGPQFVSATPKSATIRIQFKNTSGALTAREKLPGGFEIAGADRKFYPAKAVIEKESVVVSAPEVPAPVAVRYAWRNAPEVNLYNAAGLPAAPFRTDKWE